MSDSKTGTSPLPGRNMDLAAAVSAAEERYIKKNPLSRAYAAEAAAHMPGGNTRTTVYFSPFPLYLAGGSGSRLSDADGHSYVDFVNEYTAAIYGHSNAVIAETIRTTLAQGINLGGCTPHEIDLANDVRHRFPSMELIRFCNSGTEANLLALSAARAFTGKPAVMTFEGGYHGSMLYFAKGGSPLNAQFEWVVSRYNDLAKTRADISANAHRLAAVIVEPLQGSGGAFAPEPGFIEGLRAACSEHRLLLIFDEVMSSRLGFGGLQGELGVRPDMTTLGKYVGGGLSFGAFGGRADIMAKFDPSQPGAYPHGGTFNNNVLAMAAGHAGLTQVLSRERLAVMNALGDRLRRDLQDVADRHRAPVRITGRGSIFGIHFNARTPRNSEDQLAHERGREARFADLRKLFHLEMLAAGIYVARRSMGTMSIETSAADVEAFRQAFDVFLGHYGALIRDIAS